MTDRRYDAFISYSRDVDGKLAPALQAALQRFAKPWYRRRMLRIFRDDASLAANPGLWSSIQRALDDARCLILMGSPGAVASRWVPREVEHWLDRRGGDGLIIVLTSGGARWDEERGDFDWAATDALPKTLAGAFSEAPRWVDMTWVQRVDQLSERDPRFKDAIADIAVPIHGREKDALVGEDVRQHRRTKRVATGAGISLAALAIGMSVAAVLAVRAERQSHSRELARQADALLPIDPRESLEQARRALAIDGTPEARASLDEALIHARECLRTPAGPGPVSSVDFDAAGPWIAAAGPGPLVRVMDSRSGLPRLARRIGDAEQAKVAFALTGSRLVARGRDGDLRILDMAGAREPAGSPPAAFGVSDFAVSPDGRLIAAVQDPGPARPAGLILLRAHDGRVVARAPIPGGAVARAVGFAPNGDAVATAGLGGSTFLWTLPGHGGSDRRPRAVALRGQRGPLVAVAFTRSGRWVASAGRAGRTVVWPVTGGHRPRPLPAQGGIVLSLDGGPGDLLAIAGQGGRVRLVDARSGMLRRQLLGHTGLVTRVRFSPSGRAVATASNDGTLRIFDAASGGVRAVLAGHHANVRDLAFSPDGRRLVSGGFDGTARVWDIAGGGSALELGVDGTSLLDVAAGPGGRIAFASFGGRVLLTDRGGAARVLVGRFAAPVQRVLFVPDGRLAIADHSGRLLVSDADGFVDVDQLLHRGIVYDVAVSVGGRRLATAGNDGYARVVDLASGTIAGAGRYGDGRSPILAAALDRAGRRLVTADDAGRGRIWEVGSGEAIAALPHDREVFDIALSPDDRTVVTASADQTAAIWRASDGKLLHRLVGHRAPVASAAFSPDGRLIVTASQDSRAMVWQTGSGRRLAVLDGHAAPVLRAEFTPDSRFVVTASEDGTVRVFEAATGRRRARFTGPASAVTGLAITHDGRQVATSSADGFGRVFDVPRPPAGAQGEVSAGIVPRAAEPSHESGLCAVGG